MPVAARTAGQSPHGSTTIADIDEARLLGGSVYYPHRLRCAGEPSDFAMHLRARRLGPLTVGVLGYDVEVHIETTEALNTAYEVNIPLGQGLDCWVGGRHAVATPRRAVVSDPERTSTLHGFGPGNPLFGLKVERRALEAHHLIGDGSAGSGPRLRPVIDLDAGPGRQWWSLARTLLAMLEDQDGGLWDSPMVVRPLVDSVLRGLLVAAGDDPTVRTPDPGPPAVRSATEFIRERAAEPLTVSDIAVAAGCGTRALQEAFRRHLGTTPMGQLQETRLDHARADLIAAGPGGTTVGDVCLRWGFTHPGRFSRAYQRRHGELPSATLHA